MVELAVAGIRFDQLGSEHFASFAFSDGQVLDACVQVKKRTQSNAVVIVCTCDRVEVWCEQAKTDVVEPSCVRFPSPYLPGNRRSTNSMAKRRCTICFTWDVAW